MSPKDQGYEPGSDARLDFLFEFCTRSLKIKADKWQKMFVTEEYRVIIFEFFEKENNQLLIMNLNPTGQLMVSNSYPTSVKNKSCYFMKKKHGIFLRDTLSPNWKDEFIYGDLSSTPLENLITFLEEVVDPIITTEAGQEIYPPTVVDDVKESTQELAGVLYSIQGQLKGKTLLPISISSDIVQQNLRLVREGKPGDVGTQVKVQIESLVVKWSQDINEVLKHDSAKVLSTGFATPYAELTFWEERVEDLRSIYQQLNEDQVRSMAIILDKVGSRYWPGFKTLFRNVVGALTEAQDILAHLKPFKKHLDLITAASFEDVKELIRPMMHCLCLIWGHSKHYCHAPRIIVMLREICNLIIELARGYLGGSSVFQLEPEEGYGKANLAYDVLHYFRILYGEHRAILPVYFKEGVEPKSWDFLPHLVFHRYDIFLERMKKLKDCFETSAEFYKLERCDIGGSKGRLLSTKVHEIYTEFVEYFQKFSNISYDCADPEDCSFDGEYDKFLQQVSDTDKRLSSIICTAFSDCHTSEACFKLILILGSLLERPLIKSDFEPKYAEYVAMIETDLNYIKDLYDEYILSVDDMDERVITNTNVMPPYSANINWAVGMIERATEQLEEFQSLDLPINDSALGIKLYSKYLDVKGLLTKFKDSTYKEWYNKVKKEAGTYLEQNIICRNEGSTLGLSVNHNVEISVLLKDVRYMKQAGFQEIPKEALIIYNEKEVFRKNLIHCDEIVRSYNRVISSMNEFEAKLLEPKLNQLDEIFKLGETKLRWKDKDEVKEFIDQLKKPIKDLEYNVEASQENIKTIEKLCAGWTEQPLLERKNGRKDQLLCLDDSANERKEKRYKEIKTISNKVHVHINQIKNLISDPANPDEFNQEFWDEYLSSIDELVLDGLIKTVATSYGYFLDHTDFTLTPSPLMEVKMLLVDGELVFEPSLDFSQPNNFLNLVEDLLLDIAFQATLFDRVKNTDETYLAVIDAHEDLVEMKGDIEERVQTVINEIYDYTLKFDQCAYLWEDSREEYLNQFLKFGRQLTLEEIEAKEQGEDIEASPAVLSQFKEAIDKFEAVYLEVKKFEREIVFDRWLRLDMRPFRKALLETVKQWSLMFKLYMVDQVIHGLSDLEKFIDEADKGLNQQLKEGDLQTLISVMGFLQQVKERQATTDKMFDPIKEFIELLKSYDYESFPENVFVQLEELPLKWASTKKLATQVRHAVAPLQAQEVSRIRRNISDFDTKQQMFRESFKKYEIFHVNSAFPYIKVNETNIEILQVEDDYRKICDAASLFEVHVPDPKALKQCRKELKFAKQLWDYLDIVQSSIDEWKTSPWQNLNIEYMDLESKKMAKEIKGFDKDTKSWEIFNYLEAVIRNMISSLKSVAELQNPSIRERHWMELLQTTKVETRLMQKLIIKFTVDSTTTLADLMGLSLHNYEDEVKNIVDKAVKESSMEKTLKELNSTWANQEYEFEVHLRTGIQLIKASEELVEILEDNQVQLQNIAISKYISFFFEEVEYWQNKLFNADQVLFTLGEVQRTWSHLESIFIGSEDIRKNLPDDSARFDQIDCDFKAVLQVLSKSKNVVESTNQPGVLPELERLQKELSICEKALADYLETKRLAFPRFYFVSSVDLLDILSNGNEPEMVARHLTKLFDSLAKLGFGNDKGQNKSTKIAFEMKAKDGEVVTLNKPCDCTGAVEVWLNALEESMRSTIRHYFKVSVKAYVDKAREQWIMEYPAQNALCGTQIWWTTEVGIAFSKLEEGYENALKDYVRKQIGQLNTLIGLLLGSLTAQERQKIMTICTIDVHSRDVVQKLIQQRVETSSSFQWQCQLRHRWDEAAGHCYSNICDAQFQYWYEYLGNTPRLVITPLTDRCYITLTQSLHLVMGGAPQGPAGTGKTETTKDLGRALGMMVYVFNCSEQMDYRSVGNIYKGLSQTGSWGCFDEFNRITVEVLSVVAVQVKSMQDAIRDKKEYFNFMGEEIKLVPSVGIFITMNPGYAGRSELPENLKVLFRPCAMVVPDFELICEIMLVAEGFQDARILARKFITLYTLCKELCSNQAHYDWGLRAIKSVLVVAGALKRNDPERPEDQVLMRALRDFNVPKIVSDDVPVFMGLIGDLFPALDVPRKRDLEFEKAVKIATIQLKLQPEENFILKVVQLEELIDVRHSVFIVGNAGTGKTQVWKALYRTHQNLKHKPYYNDLNPKAVTSDELFGVINPSSREWKDGILSVLMRDQANLTGDGPKWIILDGDIDPMWIESLNTVMDDNKVLTLASNERIALTKMMRLLFEIYSLRTATPATVSRAGILYLNPQDLGWNSYVASWIESREFQAEKAYLTLLFEKYIPTLIDISKTRFKKITPISEINIVQLLCHLLECILTPENIPLESPKDHYEMYFVFACVWAFGSAVCCDQVLDHRVDFSKWWLNEYKYIKFPSGGSVFDFYIDPETKKFVPWTDIVPKFELDPDVPLQSLIVHTAETTRVKYFMDLLMEKGHPVMLVGTAGSGKSVLVQNKFASLSENYAVANVPFNYYTTSEMLQRILEKPLEKKAGRNYGPQGNKRLIYFIDDMNMPMVDEYGTVQPHTLIRQYLDYKHWYDRTKITLKEINNVQFVACMNPTSGSFTINPRLQRHFAVFQIGFPGSEALQSIYRTILQQHLGSYTHKFPTSLQRTAPSLCLAALQLHNKVTSTFLPTAIKFHYIFNLRDLSNIFQGLLFSTTECLQHPIDLVRLWMHEASRVYGDKLIDDKDIQTFNKLLTDALKKGFEELDETAVMAKPLIYCHFAQGMGDPKYMPVIEFSSLQKLLVDVLNSYNDFNSIMNLVLFEDAILYICRISRILESPRGNALLIGVGGSGKQSLARLAAFLSGLEVFQIQLKKGYGVLDLKANLAQLYIRAGQKNMATMFLMTDAQVAEEKFLVLINDMLASGEIPDLLQEDETENIIGSMRSEVKGVGLPDTRENCWKFFIDRVRKMLKVVLCFSPVGATLRNRSRKFPAVVNCTSIVWFHEWPVEALVSVSQRFVKDIAVLPRELLDPIANFMAFVHSSVNDMSKAYLINEKRYNYTTPKSFLEQINLYSKLVTAKNNEAFSKADRLESGLTKLESCAEQVEKLKKVLAVQEVQLKEKNDKADHLIQAVGKETAVVSVEKENAAVEEGKVAVVASEVAKIKEICRIELEKAEPALQAAYAALNTLNKANITELKTFTSPPGIVIDVVASVFILYEGTRSGKIPKDKSWKNTKSSMMSDVAKFLDALINLDKERISANMVEALKPYIDSPEFDPEFVKSKSVAAAGLCSFVINVLRYNEVFQDVAPKRKALSDATESLNKANERLKYLKSRITELENKLNILTSEYEAATDAKMKCQMEADKTALTIDLANRLVGGLGAEKNRWIQNVSNYRASTITIPGDMLLVTAFVSYVGCFSKRYRVELLDKSWIPCLKKENPAIPMSETVDPLNILTDDAEIAQWNNFGLPSDRMSSENATILINSERWPLIIDPQLQGIKWIKNMYGSGLRVIRLGQKGYLDTIEEAISQGHTVLIESIMESIDPVLEPLLARNLIKKGTAIKIGDHEIDYHPNFRLILQTKLANPHYKPEMQAQTTLINFTVTRDGLEDQLLAEVVKVERPDLESQKSELTKQQNEFKILLKKLEDDLLTRLQSAQGNFLDDTALVENLETTKRTAQEVEVKAKEAVVTSMKIDAARELYRPAAAAAALLYFILNDLNMINPIYNFSLKAFSTVFHNAIAKASYSSDVSKRIDNLIDAINFAVWQYTTRGLFESDKLIFTTLMALQIQLAKGAIQGKDLDFLLRFPITPNVFSPVDFLSNNGWGAVKSLANMDDYRNLDRDIEGSSKRWKKYVESECPEREKLPQEWKNKTGVQKLCIMRALRPDRMTYASIAFIEESLGSKFVKSRRVDFSKSFEETSNTTPVFFILSPGVDPLKDVEALGKKLGFTIDKKNFHSVSLGQGQEIVAENALDVAGEKGHWVILQNIHLVSKWLPTLEKKLEQNWDNSHQDYRVFLSAEPAQNRESHIIPQGILESSIKITNEPPTGMLANIHKALDNFGPETLETCSKELEFKAVLFSLCYFHAVVNERRKFGTQGWNRSYPFNTGDLMISVNVLFNYLEANNKVPWEDLRYLFGEIMYGGHITDDWDRRLCRTYLEEYMQQELLDGEVNYAPGFVAPASTDYYGYHQYIDEAMPPESPVLYGLHPNAEIGFLTATSETLFRIIFELQPRDSGAAGAQTITKDEKIKQILDDILDKLPDSFNMQEIQGRAEDKTPYVIVALQECERMNTLTMEIRQSLRELDLGLKGELTITTEMEDLGNALFMDSVPPAWMKKAYPSTLGLGSWYADLLLRARELELWVGDFYLPPAVWLGGFFNPQSFLTAIMQSTARKQELPLDKMCLQCDVTKKTREELTAPPKEGACIYGLFMEGARWDSGLGCITESKLKELYPPMPVVFLRAITQDKLDNRNTYECPVYKTKARGPTYVWTFNLRTKEKPAKWVLGGVAILLQV